MRRLGLIITLIALQLSALTAQTEGILYGFVRDTLRRPIDLANIAIVGSNFGTMSSQDGYYEMEIPSNKKYTIIISCVGYEPVRSEIIIQANKRNEYSFTLKQDIRAFDAVSVSARQDRASTFQRIDVRNMNYMPSTTGKIEAIIKSQAGVNTTNELSSQYSVRGGNFDENLVYVNDIEIYRPFLVRSGQQEGLSFVNSDMVSDIRFSAGGFDARYGDRMSSALDITYKKPKEFGGSTTISLLGASAHVEGASKDKRLTYLAGYRYKTTSYLLNTLETSGDYKPQFSDFQTMVSYQFSEKVGLSFLGNYSANKYHFIPETKKTQFGTLQVPLNLTIYYDGQEIDQFDTYLGALSLNINPNKDLKLKFIASAFQTNEEETFDIRGQYWINELDGSVGSESYGDSIMNIGVGTLHDHARNYLNAYVFSGSHIGEYQADKNLIKWGFKYQYQIFHDWISEWSMVDSADYIVPYNGSELVLTDSRKANHQLSYSQISSFIQDTWEINADKADIFLTTGLRATLWNFNKTFFVSPRMTLSILPNWEKDFMFHLSGGYYYQPPFYKEMRMSNDEINKDILPQRSIHLLAGGNYIFTYWDRPFKITAEIYYKWLDKLIPYKIENVRIQYSGENIASGYARGLDLKINGEFVPGAESWFTLSLLQTKEDIEGDTKLVYDTLTKTYNTVDAGYYSRPSEQLISAGIFFQDYLPNNPDYKVHLSAYIGSGIPLSHPNPDQYYTESRMRAYKRVDVGFSKVLKREHQQMSETNIFRHFNSIWISGEIFNMFGFYNEASYSWIRTVSNQEGIPGSFGVPNYLTGRRFNIKLTASF